MDSTNGVSEENHQKDDKIRFTQTGDMIRTRLDELPPKERERILAYMKMMDTDEEPEIYLVDMKLEVDDLSYLPFDFIASALRDAINDNNFEDAADYRDEIVRRGYNIEITKKQLILTLNNNS